MSAGKSLLEVRRLGRTLYEDAHREQRRLLERRIAGELPDLLLLTEHEPVLTVGRGSPVDELAGSSLPVHEVERGGEATYHGPGQVVVYPILRLDEGRRDLHRYLRDLEQVVIRLLAEFDVTGERRSGLTGVWVGEQKICSVGVAVRRWVTWHGFALNVHTDLEAFQGFQPCGLDPRVMTRLVDHADLPAGNLLVEVLAIKHFCEVFELELPPPPPLAGEGLGSEGAGGGSPLLPILPA